MVTKIRDKFKSILFVLDERFKRLWAASVLFATPPVFPILRFVPE
jgi:hypothetical protein